MKQLLAEKSGIVEMGRRLKFVEVVAVGILLSTGLFAPRARASIYTFNPGDQNKTALGSGYPVGGTLVGASTNGYSATSGGLTIQGTVISLVIQGGMNPYGS